MNNSEHLLSCLSEECAEVAQRVSKALRFGLTEIQPGQELTNAKRIVEELVDLMAVVEMLEDEGILELPRDAVAINLKKDKVRRFMTYAKQCGTLEGAFAVNRATTDAEVMAWVKRHDLDRALAGADARTAIDDAASVMITKVDSTVS